MIAPDDTTFEYLKGRPRAPQGAAWDKAVAAWRELPSDDGRRRSIARRSSTRPTLEPMITYGTNPGMGIPISGAGARRRRTRRRAKALAYMGLQAKQPLLGPQGRRRVHRQLHELAPVGPARRRQRAARAARSPTACACWSCRARSEIKTRGRGRGPGPGVPRRGRRVARGRLLDVHRDERRPAVSRASTRSARATATSRGGRARAAARSSPAR